MIPGSALCALEGKKPEMRLEKIKELIMAIDEQIPLPARDHP